MPQARYACSAWPGASLPRPSRLDLDGDWWNSATVAAFGATERAIDEGVARSPAHAKFGGVDLDPLARLVAWSVRALLKPRTMTMASSSLAPRPARSVCGRHVPLVTAQDGGIGGLSARRTAARTGLLLAWASVARRALGRGCTATSAD